MTASLKLPLILEETGDTCQLGILEVLKGDRPVGLPLQQVDISARVADRVAEVTLVQKYYNPHTELLEAVYTFPLPGGAAVSRFELHVGDRLVVGKVQERSQARAEYQQALAEGKRAALLEQERDDVFTMQVGNIPPGEEVSVRLVYSQRLPFFEAGTTELRLPLVVAPRYISGSDLERAPAGDGVSSDTDRVPDASRISPPRLAEGFDPKVSLNLAVELLGGGLQQLACSQHAVQTEMDGDSIRVGLAREDELLNRDFVLRWRLAGEAIASHLLYYRDSEGDAYGLLSVLPPRRSDFLGVPRDIVFVLDRSGSMESVKMASAARACALLLGTLGPRDRFAIQAFDDRVEWFEPREGLFLPADEAGLERGQNFLRQIESRGGTELDQALEAALEALQRRSEASGRAPIIVLLTDGQIGDESQVLKRIQQQLGDSRVFTVGIDTAVNEGFLKKLAALGGGTASFVVPGEKLEAALEAIGREIGQPLLTGLELSGPLDKSSLTPARLPDLFAGRATVIFFKAGSPEPVSLRGRLANGEPFAETVPARTVELPALAQLWARSRVTDLEDRFRLGQDTRQQIIDLAVRHTLLTRFTAFVAVDEAEKLEGADKRRKVVQPVAMPDKWAMPAPRPPAAMPAGPMFLQAVSTTGALPPSEPPVPVKGKKSSLLKGISRFFDSAPKAESPPDKYVIMESIPEYDLDAEAALDNVREHIGSLGAALEFTAAEEGEEEASASDKRATALEDYEALRRQMKGEQPSALTAALEQLGQALETIWSAIAAGQVPLAGELEAARSALLEALNASSRATEVPLLQRFLRTDLPELVAALNTPAITGATLQAMAQRHQKAWEAARQEVGQRVQGASGNFWEKTI